MPSRHLAASPRPFLAALILGLVAASPAWAADTDGDGLDDGFEVAHGFDPLDPDENSNGIVDGQDDFDLDGLGNAAEERVGTDPNDPDTDDDGLLDGEEVGTGIFGAEQVISTSADGAFSVFAADVDGDGDLDALSASSSDDKIAWYENTDGAGSFGPEQLISTDADGARSVFAADVDGDGDLDALSASLLDDKIAWYENTDGAGSFGPEQVISTSADAAFSVFAADVDGDGDVDVLSASLLDDKIAWYENTDGAGSFGPEQLISTSADGARSVFAADVDGDGDVDALSASFDDDKIAWYENTDGAGSFGPEQVISTSANGAHSVFVADLDGDGDLDALSSHDQIAWYENTDGAGTFGPEQVISTSANADALIAADVDTDGDIDALFVSQGDNKIAWYENTDGAGSFGPENVISTSANGPVSVFAADVDGDGDFDALAAALADDKIAWYENLNLSDPLDPDSDDDGLLDGFEVANGFDARDADEDANGILDSLDDADGDGATNAAEQLAGTDPNDVDSDADGLADGAELDLGTDPLAADTDEDGLLDGLEQATGQFVFAADLSTAALGAQLGFPADVDGDGDMDVVSASRNDDTVAWHENTDGLGSFGPAQSITTNADGARALTVVDVDGDGDADVIVASLFDDKVAWHENVNGSGTLWSEHPITLTAFGARAVFAADVDGDGDADVVSASSSNDTVAWFENTDGAGSFGAAQIITAAADGAASVVAIDLDRDGDLDVVAASEIDDTVAWFENTNGLGTAWFEREITTSANGARSVFASDVDRDGDVDVVVASAVDDTVAWFDNDDGLGTVWVEREITTASNGATSVFALDLDLDGDTDVLAASELDDRISWFENTDAAGTSWTVHDIAQDADFAQSAIAADFDGDITPDVVTASRLDDTIAWYRQRNVSNPLVADTDGDGLLDGFEVDHGFDPLTDGGEATADGDGDGLDNLAEQAAGTDPTLADTDGDGTDDGTEVAAGTDPLDGFVFPVVLSTQDVEDAGNAADHTGFGAVAAPYEIGTFEVTKREYASFLNAVADDDPNGLFNATGDPAYGVVQLGAAPDHHYEVASGAEDQPVNFVSLYDAMRFVNWLHNGQPTGAQDASTTEDGAYTITPAGIAANDIVLNPGALFALPSEDEWYKAAYYDTGSQTYFESPAGSMTPIGCDAPGATPDTANCGGANGVLTDVGAYTGTPSPNGTFDQGGNVWEWTEDIDGSERRIRGGSLFSLDFELEASGSGMVTVPDDEATDLGFRVVVVPEPEVWGAFGAGAVLLAGLATSRRRGEHRSGL